MGEKCLLKLKSPVTVDDARSRIIQGPHNEVIDGEPAKVSVECVRHQRPGGLLITTPEQRERLRDRFAAGTGHCASRPRGHALQQSIPAFHRGIGLGFQALKALSASSPSIAKATEGKWRKITAFIEPSSTQSIPSFV
jgi:hypothetical protein